MGCDDIDDTIWDTCATTELFNILRGLSGLVDTETSHTSARAREENGVSGGGLMTAVHPAARAAPSFRVIIAEGKFHGVSMEL